jgi:general secretion pathway protein N
MRRRTLFTLFAGLFVLAMIALMPMRFILPETALSARKVAGSIWSARLEGVSFGSLPLADLNAGLRWPGRLVFEDGARLSGSISPKSGGLSVRDLQGKLLLAGVDRSAQDVEFLGVSLDFGEDGCVNANGRVRLRLVPSIAGVAMGQTLVGSPRCDSADLLIRLTSQSGLEALTFRVAPDRSTKTEMLIRPADREAGAALLAAGFVETPTGYRFASTGKY